MFQRDNKINCNDLGDRQYFLDWVRIIAFAFLVFYHAAMMFVDWPFHIESGHNSLLLKTIMIWSSQWRLDILFIVSGVAISYMSVRMPLKSFLWNRVLKLYFPLLFAIAVIVVPQSYYEALQKEVFDGGFWQFWTSQYFTFSWDDRMIAPFPTYNHMWYVLYLFHYSLVLLPFLVFINTERGHALLVSLQEWLVKGARIVWLPLIIYLAIFFMFDSPEINHTFHSDWYGHSIFIFSVILGVCFARMPRIWEAFEKIRYISLVIGLVSFGFLLTLFLLPNELVTFDKEWVWAGIGIWVKWSWIALIIGFAKKYLNHTNKVQKYCNELIYPFFILHQTILIIIGYNVIDWGVSGALAYIVVVAGSFILCGLLYELIIKRVNILRVLFGLKWIPTNEMTSPRFVKHLS
jgi:glucan biosynthesis protein C